MENRINIGELDTKVTVQTCAKTRGNQGQAIYTYPEYGVVWAKVERNVTEAIDNYNLEQGESISVTLYKIPALTTRWRVVVDGVAYGITAIDPISRFSPLCTIQASAIK